MKRKWWKLKPPPAEALHPQWNSYRSIGLIAFDIPTPRARTGLYCMLFALRPKTEAICFSQCFHIHISADAVFISILFDFVCHHHLILFAFNVYRCIYCDCHYFRFFFRSLRFGRSIYHLPSNPSNVRDDARSKNAAYHTYIPSARCVFPACVYWMQKPPDNILCTRRLLRLPLVLSFSTFLSTMPLLLWVVWPIKLIG